MANFNLLDVKRIENIETPNELFQLQQIIILDDEPLQCRASIRHLNFWCGQLTMGGFHALLPLFLAGAFATI
jgi:hypothetical protein